MSLAKSQQTAIARFEQFLNERLSASSVEKYGNQVTKFEVQEHEGFVTISAETELTGLPKTNLLRALDHQTWLVFVGKKGGLVARMYPESLKQFKGSRAFGIKFK